MFKSHRRQCALATYDLNNLRCFIAVDNALVVPYYDLQNVVVDNVRPLEMISTTFDTGQCFSVFFYLSCVSVTVVSTKMKDHYNPFKTTVHMQARYGPTSRRHSQVTKQRWRQPLFVSTRRGYKLRYACTCYQARQNPSSFQLITDSGAPPFPTCTATWPHRHLHCAKKTQGKETGKAPSCNPAQQNTRHWQRAARRTAHARSGVRDSHSAHRHG
ncbi:hypothetical protein V8E55_011763 [Tylopilus felleus]